MKDGDGGSVAPAGVWLVWVLRGVGRAVMLVCVVFVLGSCRWDGEQRGHRRGCWAICRRKDPGRPAWRNREGHGWLGWTVPAMRERGERE